MGPGGQSAFSSVLQREGRFPGTIWLITPHSTYLGTVAELGAAGLAALLLILVAGGLTINRLLADSARLRWEAAAYAGAGAAFLIKAISTDLLNCRHYWFLLAVMAARLDSRALGGLERAGHLRSARRAPDQEPASPPSSTIPGQWAICLGDTRLPCHSRNQ